MFDAAAALVGVCLTSSYEGEGAMRLEALCDGEASAPVIALPLTRDATGIWRSDWAPALIELRDSAQSAADRAARFHATLAHALVSQALAIREDSHINHVVWQVACSRIGCSPRR